MYRTIIGGVLVVVGATSAFAAIMLNMQLMFTTFRLKSSKAPRALGGSPESFDRHAKLHPFSNKRNRVLTLMFFGMVCLMLGVSILMG